MGVKKGWRAGIALFMAIALILSGCSTSGDSDSQSQSEQVLKLNLPNGEPTSLDPAKAFDAESMEVINALFEGLMRLDENHQPKPAVAEKVDVSPDGLTYTFTLRKDAKWSNGEPLTAHDFEYAWKRVLDPKTASSAAFLLYFIENAEEYNTEKASADQVGVKAKDDYTLEVRLTKPTPFFLQLTAYTVYYPVYKKGLEEDPKLYENGDSYVSNGPFKMKEWKHDSAVKTVKNEHYREKDRVKLGGIEWAMVSDPSSAYQMFKTGKLHSATPPPDILPSLIKNGEAKVLDGSGLEFFRFNVEEKPFTNKKIRKAFALAVDRKSIVERVVQGNQQPALAFVAPGTMTQLGDFREGREELIADNQVEEAKRLLKEGMKEEGWKSLPTVTLLYNANEKNKLVAEALQEMYRKNLGVKIKLQSQETKVFFDSQINRNYQMSRSSFLPDYNDPYNYLESFQTGHSMNRTGWSNKKYDELLEKSTKAKSEEERVKLLQEAEELLMEEMPVFPLYYYNNVIMESPNLKNVLRHPVGPPDYKEAELAE
jgi:dipeptide transport system substrate-binding protein